jgi:hypothetical protein
LIAGHRCRVAVVVRCLIRRKSWLQAGDVDGFGVITKETSRDDGTFVFGQLFLLRFHP